jgi:hypothetical protein
VFELYSLLVTRMDIWLWRRTTPSAHQYRACLVRSIAEVRGVSRFSTRNGLRYCVLQGRLTSQCHSRYLATSTFGSGPALFQTPPMERFARRRLRFNGRMAPRFVTILTGRDLPRIRQDVGQRIQFRVLHQRCGERDALKLNGYFERSPHQTRHYPHAPTNHWLHIS